MNQDNKIDNIILDGINIIEIEVAKLKSKSALNKLTKQDMDMMIEYLKALVIVRKDYRVAEKEEILDTKKLTDEEIDKILLDEASKILDVK